MSYYSESLFVTLTYDDDHLPSSASISKDELQRFLKRLRKLLDVRRIKYFAAGEYGDQKGTRVINPHYHLIIFGVGFIDYKILIQAWPFGSVYLGAVNYKTARYTAKYIMKKLSGKKAYDEFTKKGLEIPFQLQSRGIGSRWCYNNTTDLTRHMGFTIAGKPVPLPRYYKKILNNDILNNEIKKKAEEVANDLRHNDDHAKMDTKEYAAHYLSSIIQADDTAIAYTAMKKDKL